VQIDLQIVSNRLGYGYVNHVVAQLVNIAREQHAKVVIATDAISERIAHRALISRELSRDSENGVTLSPELAGPHRAIRGNIGLD
jgi:hypothetical protein